MKHNDALYTSTCTVLRISCFSINRGNAFGHQSEPRNLAPCFQRIRVFCAYSEFDFYSFAETKPCVVRSAFFGARHVQTMYRRRRFEIMQLAGLLFLPKCFLKARFSDFFNIVSIKKSKIIARVWMFEKSTYFYRKLVAKGMNSFVSTWFQLSMYCIYFVYFKYFKAFVSLLRTSKHKIEACNCIM